MKFITTVTDITHDDLVNLLCTATYGSNYFMCAIKKADYYGTELENPDDCREDKWAKVLLSCKPIIVRDYYAEDDKDFYGKLPHDYDLNRECMNYTVTLDDIKKGLERIFREGGWGASYVMDLVEDNGGFDLDEAESVLQRIIFGQEIYG